jgi:hypothetical protein
MWQQLLMRAYAELSVDVLVDLLPPAGSARLACRPLLIWQQLLMLADAC